jgi:hypothetical protein
VPALRQVGARPAARTPAAALAEAKEEWEEF